jgi:hypothetical protein
MTRASASKLARYLVATGYVVHVQRCRAAGHRRTFWIVVRP